MRDQQIHIDSIQEKSYSCREEELIDKLKRYNIVQWELETIDVNYKNSNGESLFYYAMQANDTEAIYYLLSKNFAINEAVTSSGLTALHLAVVHNLADLLPKLLSLGADITARTKYNDTPLQIALLQGNKKIANYLKSKLEELS